jgi:OmpA family
VAGQIEPGKYRVFFTFNQATLTADGARVVGEAAEKCKRTDAARIAVTGHTDLSGSPAYNQALSERRAEAVQGALVWLGVPASVIGEGENDPLVPTAEGMREARNRRVEIEIPQPAPAPAPVAPAPVAGAPEAGPPPASRWAHDFGGWYGYNLQETNGGGRAICVPPELDRVSCNPNPLSFEVGGFHAFDSEHDGFGGRSVIGVNWQGDLGTTVHSYIGANFGGVLGEGVQDGLVASPEAGLREVVPLRQGGYDYQFRNDPDEGIVKGGLRVGWRH